jgi:hypothetical protein
MLTEINGKPHVHVFNREETAKVIHLETRHEGDKTIYKALIDTALWPGGLSKGTKLPFSFTVNETDEQGYRGWLQWTPGICGGFNPNAFGEVLLE